MAKLTQKSMIRNRRIVVPLAALFYASLLAASLRADEPKKPPTDLAAKLDAYLDARFAPRAGDTQALVAELGRAGVDAAGLEKMLRGGRASYPPAPAERGKLLGPFPLPCDHVDHATQYLLYVPKVYKPENAAPLLVVGHGGSAYRDLAFGQMAARAGLGPWLPTAEHAGAVVVAPLTDRGWGLIGNSVLFTAISRMNREFNIDPDRIYLTGHSMGGHLSWRTAINLSDRFAAISPMSGGYDFVKDKQIYNCINVPGYATFGTNEPYGINGFNHINADWMKAHNYDWVLQEKRGGHQIFPDEIPKIWKFFMARPRNLYRPLLYARASGPLEFATADQNPRWSKQSTWRPGRPISTATFHWLRLHPLPTDAPEDRKVQSERAEVKKGNTLAITAENAKRLTLYLHPKMVDFSVPVKVVVNGHTVFEKKVEPDLATMLELVREFDDRGRVFWAKLNVDVADSQPVGEPKLPADGKMP